MTRGQIANKLNVNPETIRYYEKVGLITPMILENSYRYYNEELFEKLELIISFKTLGFTLKEIKLFFELIYRSKEDPKRFNTYLNSKISDIDKKIESLNSLKQSLTIFRDKEDRERCKKFSNYLNKY